MTGPSGKKDRRPVPCFLGIPGGKPAMPLRRGERFIGRPYLIWKDNPDLARSINDVLAQLSEVD